MRFTLRDLPFSARLTLAVFLVTVGLGYLSALVQLHFQHAADGRLLPSTDDAVRTFHGDPKLSVSQLERLITAAEDLPFNGTGSMAAAFTKRSDGWTRAIRQRPEAEVRKERDGEKAALLAWVKAGLPRDAFDADKFAWAGGPITADYRDGDAVKVKTLFADRCGRCHRPEGDDAAAAPYPMETHEQILKYATVGPNPGAMSLTKLAQTTHAHLLSFAMLFTMTGLVVALSSYPAWLRVPLAPLVLIAQVLDIACWWLARIDGPPGEMFARMIVVTGGVVGLGLLAQIVLGLYDLLGRKASPHRT